MRITTAHAHVQAEASELFEYVSDVANLPEWSTEFIHEAELRGDRLRARTNAGELTFRIEADRATGVADIVAEREGEPPAVFPARVVELPGGTSLYHFTLVQAPDQEEAVYEAELESLRRELDVLRRRFEE